MSVTASRPRRVGRVLQLVAARPAADDQQAKVQRWIHQAHGRDRRQQALALKVRGEPAHDHRGQLVIAQPESLARRTAIGNGCVRLGIDGADHRVYVATAATALEVELLRVAHNQRQVPRHERGYLDGIDR